MHCTVRVGHRESPSMVTLRLLADIFCIPHFSDWCQIQAILSETRRTEDDTFWMVPGAELRSVPHKCLGSSWWTGRAPLLNWLTMPWFPASPSSIFLFFIYSSVHQVLWIQYYLWFQAFKFNTFETELINSLHPRSFIFNFKIPPKKEWKREKVEWNEQVQRIFTTGNRKGGRVQLTKNYS